MAKQAQKKSDTAVIEQHYGTEWLVMTYIGPDRRPMVFLPRQVLRGGSMRVRYLGE